ncbi:MULTISPECIES: hypothetical protein [Pseudomonas]|uniref:Uncharacterized protein n=1 Tax=Pseudomonas lutea TaxID=243924 RepID=A0A9X8MHP9_9PSED|nr:MULTISPECIES: hypothetical protein [Pseudomonas]SER48114.1 hypothetical protein SAMN05216409_1274 [Pseudomonas lutea]
MDFNWTIRHFSTNPEVDPSYERTMKAAHTLASLLLAQAKGSYVDLGDNEILFIGPYKDQLELYISHDFANDIEPEECQAFVLNEAEYLQVLENEEFTARIEKWLASPVFLLASPKDLPERIAMHTEAMMTSHEEFIASYFANDWPSFG